MKTLNPLTRSVGLLLVWLAPGLPAALLQAGEAPDDQAAAQVAQPSGDQTTAHTADLTDDQADAEAAAQAALDTLVFDAVPIAVEQDAAGSLQITELASPPGKGAAVRPGAWLAANSGRRDTAAPADPDSSLTRLEQQVLELEVNEGPFSARLPQLLEALGTALQEAGELEQAQQRFQQAMHIARVHHGLFSDMQFPYIRRSIDNHLQQGNLLAADEQQRYLFYLQQRNHGDDSTALLSALEDYAEWNIFAFNAPVLFPALALDGKASVDPALFRIERLLHAQHIYWSISQLLVEKFGKQDPRLPDAEKRIALTNYFFATTIATSGEALNAGSSALAATTPTPGLGAAPSVGDLGYRQGRDALERRLAYLETMPVSEEEKLRAALDVADWMLYFSRQRMKAIDLYAGIRSEFAARLPAGQLQAVLEPPHPEALPSFIRPAWSRAALGLPADLALDYQGHIDVEFELNRFGRTTSVRSLGSSDPAARVVEQRLLRNLRRTQFRPRFDGEQPRLGETLQMRYYYSW